MIRPVFTALLSLLLACSLLLGEDGEIPPAEAIAQGLRDGDTEIFFKLYHNYLPIDDEVVAALLSLLDSPQEKRSLAILAHAAHDISLQNHRDIARALIAKVPESPAAAKLVRARIGDWPELVAEHLETQGIDAHGRLLLTLTGLEREEVSLQLYDRILHLVVPVLDAEAAVQRAKALRTWYHFEMLPDRQLLIRQRLHALAEDSDDQDAQLHGLQMLAEMQHPEDFAWLWERYRDHDHPLSPMAAEVLPSFITPEMSEAAVERMLQLATQVDAQGDQSAAAEIYRQLYAVGLQQEDFVAYMARWLESEERMSAWNAVNYLVTARYRDRDRDRAQLYRHPRWDALIRALDASDPEGVVTHNIGEIPPSRLWESWREWYFHGLVQ